MSDYPTELARVIALIDKLAAAKDDAEPWAMISYLIDLAMVETMEEFQALTKRELERSGGLN